MDAAPSALLVVGEDWRIRYLNRVGAAQLGVEKDALVGRDLWDAFPESENGPFRSLYELVMSDGVARRLEAEYPPLGRWFRVEVFRMGGGIGIVFQDTTSQQRQLGELEQARASLARAQRISRIGSWSWDLATDTVRWSDELFRLVGREGEDASKALAFDVVATVIHPDDLPRMQEALDRAITGDAPYDIELRVLQPGGEVMEVQAIGEVVRDAHGRVTGMEGTMQDVSALRRAERALRESRALLARTQAAARIASWVMHLDTMTVHWEPENWELWGQDPATFVPSAATMMAVVHPDDVARVAEHTARAETTAGPMDFTVRIRTASGEERHLRTVGDTVLDERTGQPARIVGITIDETDRVRAEAQRQAIERQLQHAQRLESLGVLAGGIAHDFNNLLVGILGNTSLALLDAPPGSGLREPLLGIEQAAQRATDLTRQLLAYSGKGRFVVEHLDLSRLVSEMSSLVQASISKKTPLRLSLVADPPPVEGDATQLRQVVMNLLTNASEAMGEHGGELRVRTGVQEIDTQYAEGLVSGVTLPPGRYVFVEVSDSGHGIAPDKVPRIFEPFYTTKFTGRGLGLAATLGIVRGHSGGISVYSELGVGTTIKVLLPVTDGIVAGQGERRAEQALVGSGTVLIVDDDAAVRKVTQQILIRRGFEVVQAIDGEEALAVVAAQGDTLRLVLLDLTMPKLGGEEVFRRLRTMQPSLPVVMMSGYNEQNVTQQFVGKGLAGFVQKPFSAAELYARIAEVLG